MTKQPLIAGDVVEGYEIGYEDPLGLRHAITVEHDLGAFQRMGHWVPVPGKVWSDWLVLQARDEACFLVPILWNDLGHFKKHLRTIDAQRTVPVVGRNLMGYWFAALLGFGVWRNREEIVRGPIQQRRVSDKLVYRLRCALGASISDNPRKLKTFRVVLRHGEWLWCCGEQDKHWLWHRDKSRAIKLDLNMAAMVADNHSGFILS